MIDGIASFLDARGYSLSHYLLTALWQSTLLIAAAWWAERWLRRRRAAVRHAMWVLVIGVTPFLPLISAYQWSHGTPQATLRVIPPRTTMALPPANSLAPVVDSPQNPGSLPIATLNTRSVSKQSAPPIPETAAMAPRPNPLRRYPWAAALLVYAAGCASLLCWTILGRLRIRRWITNSRPVNDPAILDAYAWTYERIRLPRSCMLRISDEIPVSLAVGMRHPSILLPAALMQQLHTEQELRTLLLHEAAHIRRRDPLILGLGVLLQAFFFFHPLVWIVTRHIARLAEYCADDAVLDAVDAPIPYAQMLVRLAEELPARPVTTQLATGFLWGRGAFLGRVEAILNRRPFRRLSIEAMACGLFLFIGACALTALVPLGERGARGDVDAAIEIICVTNEAAADAPERIGRTLALIEKHPQSETLPALVDWLGVQKDTKRRSAIYLIGKINWENPKSALKPMRALTKHKEDTTRGMACLTLGYLGDKDSFDLVADVLNRDSSPYAQRCAAFAIGELNDPRGLKLVEPLAMERNSKVQTYSHDFSTLDNAADAYWRLKWMDAYAGATPAEQSAARGIWMIAGSTTSEKQRLVRALKLIKAADPVARKRVMDRAQSFAPEEMYYLRNSSLLAAALLTKEAEAEKTNSAATVAKIPGGTAITLLGVGGGGSRNNDGKMYGMPLFWWTPAGRRAQLARDILMNIDWIGLVPNPGDCPYLLAFRIDSDDDGKSHPDWTFEISAGGKVISDQVMDIKTLYADRWSLSSNPHIGVCLPAAATSCTLHMGVGSGPWETAAIYDAQKMEWIGAHDPKLKAKLVKNADCADLQYDWAPPGKAVKAVAKMKNGETRSYDGYSTSLKNSSLTAFFNGRPEEFTRFEFQVRPYRWVTFRNVSLVPDMKTTVVAEIGK